MAKWLRKWRRGWLYVRSNTKNAKSLLFVFLRLILILQSLGILFVTFMKKGNQRNLFWWYRIDNYRKKYTSGPRYWNVPVLVNTWTFLVYQYCPKMWYLRSLEHAGLIQKLTILECKNGLVLSNTRVPVFGTWSILFHKIKNNFARLLHLFRLLSLQSVQQLWYLDRTE